MSRLGSARCGRADSLCGCTFDLTCCRRRGRRRRRGPPSISAAGKLPAAVGILARACPGRARTASLSTPPQRTHRERSVTVRRQLGLVPVAVGGQCQAMRTAALVLLLGLLSGPALAAPPAGLPPGIPPQPPKEVSGITVYGKTDPPDRWRSGAVGR